MERVLQAGLGVACASGGYLVFSTAFGGVRRLGSMSHVVHGCSLFLPIAVMVDKAVDGLFTNLGWKKEPDNLLRDPLVIALSIGGTSLLSGIIGPFFGFLGTSYAISSFCLKLLSYGIGMIAGYGLCLAGIGFVSQALFNEDHISQRVQEAVGGCFHLVMSYVWLRTGGDLLTSSLENLGESLKCLGFFYPIHRLIHIVSSKALESIGIDANNILIRLVQSIFSYQTTLLIADVLAPSLGWIAAPSTIPSLSAKVLLFSSFIEISIEESLKGIESLAQSILGKSYILFPKPA